MKCKKLAVNIPVINDVTSFYRAANPLAQIAQSYPGLYWNPMTQWNDAFCRAHDGAFFQRPCTNEHRGAMQMCMESGMKVWVDYDDLLTEIPTANPTYYQYMAKNIQENIEWCIKNADIVTVSTAPLAAKISQWSKNVRVVPNALDTSLKSVKERGTPKPRNKIMAWRGTPTHTRDLLRYARAILTVSRDETGPGKEWLWHFIGDTAWIVSDSMVHHRTFLTKPMGTIEYHRHIQLMQPSCFHVPLDESDFNRCKSNIAWIEASFAGAACIAPAWEVWDVPGAILYKSEEEYANAMYAVIKGEVDVEKSAKTSWDFIQENLTLEKVNEARVDVMCELFNCDRSDLR